MSPLTTFLGLSPIHVPGIEPQAEQAEDQQFLGWGALPQTHLYVGRRRARAGLWLRWDGPQKRSPARVWVRYEADPDSPLAPLERSRKGLLPPYCRWIQVVRHGPNTREALVEMEAGVNHEFLLADLRDFHMYGDPPVLVSDPDDTRPLGGRVAVVVSHGLLWDSPHLRLSGITAPIFFNALRRHKAARKLRDRVRWYRFDYPCWRTPAENGAALSEAGRLLLERDEPRHPLLLVGHSMGGLVARFAMNNAQFGERVGVSISAGSPHRGAFIVSLAAATSNLRLHLSGFDLALLRQGFGALMPDCPGSRGVFWDNSDGSFDRPGWEAYGLPDNPDLARFNREDVYLDKLYCLAGDCPRLGFNRWVSPHERIRWAQARYFEGFENVDPFVPLTSASLEGAPVVRAVHPGADHLGWAIRSWQVKLLVEAIAERV
ncbi:MAG: hypothetical protein HY303_09320 [Candidatus Wallbacteria bacterium]|nr:hypothetical protein [Candidatus Wallbacteria bacterium]